MTQRVRFGVTHDTRTVVSVFSANVPPGPTLRDSLKTAEFG